MANTMLGKVCVTPKGEYDASATYEPLDIVRHEGTSYIVKRTCSGVTPVDGDDYMLIASGGASEASGGFRLVEILPSATFSKGAKLNFSEAPSNFDFFWGRIGYQGTFIGAIGGSNPFALKIGGATTSSNTGTDIVFRMLTITYDNAGDTQATLLNIAYIKFSGGEISAQGSLDSAQIGPLYGIQLL